MGLDWRDTEFTDWRDTGLERHSIYVEKVFNPLVEMSTNDTHPPEIVGPRKNLVTDIIILFWSITLLCLIAATLYSTYFRRRCHRLQRRENYANVNAAVELV